MAGNVKKSPWMGPKKVEAKREEEPQEVDAADLPLEVYEAKVEDDDVKIERALLGARLLETPVPPASEWQACWACGQKAPLRFRDPMFGILVCRKCLFISAQHEVWDKSQEMFGTISEYLGVLPDDDEGDGGEGEGDVRVPMIVNDQAQDVEVEPNEPGIVDDKGKGDVHQDQP